MAATGAAALVGADGVSIALKKKKKTTKEKDLISVKEAKTRRQVNKKVLSISQQKRLRFMTRSSFSGLYLHK